MKYTHISALFMTLASITYGFFLIFYLVILDKILKYVPASLHEVIYNTVRPGILLFVSVCFFIGFTFFVLVLLKFKKSNA